MGRVTETDLYPPVKAWLEALGYEVKAEIGPVDVMAVRAGGDPVVVELKAGFSLTLLQQAVARQAVTDTVYVAVPRWSGKSGWRAFKGNVGLCKRLGVGVLTVRLEDGFVQVHADPTEFRPRKSKTRRDRLLSEFARREGDDYVVNGQKIWISRAEHSDLMVLLCRTTPREECAKPSDGMSVLLVDMREAVGNGLTIRPVRTMLNHATTELFFDDLRVPASALIGEEGKGFRYILSGMNAERILIASECIGDGRFFIDRAAAYAKDRSVFGRAIGENQGVQFPIARAYVQLSAAAEMVTKAARMFDAGETAGTEANMAKMLASEASWAAADMCIQTHGGFGFAEEYDIERKFRETRLYQVAPISTNLILSHVATHVLDLPKSF